MMKFQAILGGFLYDQTRWHGRRDHLNLSTAIHTGLRFSALAFERSPMSTRPADRFLRPKCVGKGHKPEGTR